MSSLPLQTYWRLTLANISSNLCPSWFRPLDEMQEDGMAKVRTSSPFGMPSTDWPSKEAQIRYWILVDGRRLQRPFPQSQHRSWTDQMQTLQLPGFRHRRQVTSIFTTCSDTVLCLWFLLKKKLNSNSSLHRLLIVKDKFLHRPIKEFFIFFLSFSNWFY